MRPEPEATSPSHGTGESLPVPTGLVVATIRCGAAVATSVVGTLDATTLRRIRQDALAMRARHAQPVTIEARFVDTAAGRALLATLDDLATHDIHVVSMPIGGRAVSPAPRTAAPAVAPADERPAPAEPPPPAPDGARAETIPAAPASAPTAGGAPSPDPFDIDPVLRRAWIRPLRLFFERYWRVEVSGLEHVPDDGAALIAANHSGAVPADAFMLGVALELRQPSRCLRVLYDRFVDALPLVGPLYRRLGGVPASLANAELLLRRGELVGLFPEGIAGVEKRYTERYRLQAFKTGTARLALRTGAPIVPVAIVGAEEAYPVVARLYRAGRLVGLPWIPVTPTFPLCGIAGALPLPTKWRMHFCAPLSAPSADGRDVEDVVAETTARLRDALATGVADLLAKRRGIFV